MQSAILSFSCATAQRNSMRERVIVKVINWSLRTWNKKTGCFTCERKKNSRKNDMQIHVYFKQLLEIKVTPLVLTAAVLTLDPEGIWTIWFLHNNFYYHSFPHTITLCGRAWKGQDCCIAYTRGFILL